MAVTTYDLSNCACCSGITWCGCTGLPRTLQATISGCISATVPMTWNGTNYYGHYDCEGCDLTLFLECNSGIPVIGFRGACPGCEGGANATVECAPFQATMTKSMGAGCSCCPGGSVTVTITE